MLLSGKFLHLCFVCCTAYCSSTKTCSVSVFLLAGFAVARQQFTVALFSLAQWRCSFIKVVVSHLYSLPCWPANSWPQVGHVFLLCQVCNPLGACTEHFTLT